VSVLVAKAGVDGGRALARVRVVMVRTRNPMNLGAAARALRNAGISRWTMVAPITDLDHPEVGRVAVKAEGLVQMANVVETLEEALAGCALSVACTARQRFDRNQLHPRTAAERLVSGAAELLKRGVEGAAGDVCLVFGDEMNGLHTEETDLCDLLSTIPSAPEQPSWNLAQAVAIYVHELRTAALSVELGLDNGQDRKDLADGAGLAALDRTLAAMLDQFGRLRTRRRLFRTLERAQPSRREAALWTGVLENLRRALAGEPLTGGSGGPDRD
jgi:TrmH family RNA methyltransferase